MRLLIQRSLSSNVVVDDKIVGSIEKGMVVFVGFTHTDTEKDIDYCVNKLLNLRIYNDENDQMNLSIKDVGGEILSVSQFTLYGDTKKGNRPSFVDAMKFDEASKMFDLWNQKLKQNDIKVETGIFGADMEVSITNDGPVTILIESR